MLRLVLTILMLSLGFLLPPSEAQQVTRIPRVGFVAPQGRSLPLFDAFRQGLANLGYVDGQNILVEPRFAEGHYDRFPDIFAELVGLKFGRPCCYRRGNGPGCQEGSQRHSSGVLRRGRSSKRPCGSKLGAA